MKLITSLFIVLALVSVHAGQATNTVEQVKSLTVELQKAPSDAALREKVIKLALTVNPKPSTPPEADELFGRAKYLINNAASDADFAAAAKAFSDASNLAPWEGDYYFNQGMMFEKAKQYDKAIEAFKWYLLAAPDSAEAKAVREKIGGLKVAIEKRNDAEQARLRDEEAQRQAEQARQNRLRPIEDLKRFVTGRTYYSNYCTVGYQDLGNGGRIGRGCNWAERDGSNWYTYWKGQATDEWDFSVDGEARFVIRNDSNPISRIRFRAMPNGAGSIQWECADKKFTPPNNWTLSWKAAFVTHSADFSSVTVTCDTPSPQSSPGARFQYNWFKMN